MTELPAEPHPLRALARLAAGTASRAERRRAVRHLIAGCPACGRRLARNLLARTAEDPLTAVVARAAASMPELERRVEAEREAAAAILDRLDDQPPARQRLFLANAVAAHRRAVCELLLERARGQRHASAQETLRLAELALLVAERVGGSEAPELHARAWAEVGNARRILADLAGAARAFVEAERLLAGGCVDPLVRAELLSLRASLAHHQRRFNEAVSLLDQAAAVLAECGDGRQLAKVLLQRAAVHARQGRPEAGIAAALRALDFAEASDDPALPRIAIQNLISLVAEAGQPERAAALVVRARPLFDLSTDRLDRLRFEWVAGRIDADLGLARSAAAQFEVLREAYAAAALPYETALVSLDLAAVYAREGRRPELAALAAQGRELFARLGIHREQIAALGLLARTGRVEALRIIGELAAAVEAARRAPPTAASGTI